MNLFINWVRWCIQFKEIMPWEVCLVSHNELTEEEYNYPSEVKFEIPVENVVM